MVVYIKDGVWAFFLGLSLLCAGDNKKVFWPLEIVEMPLRHFLTFFNLASFKCTRSITAILTSI